MEVVCGLDVGTSGAKAFAVDPAGAVVARAECKFARPPYEPAPGLAEQEGEEWWTAAKACLRQLCSVSKAARISALAADSTSGTIVPVDRLGRPLSPALMYNDGRASGLEAEVNEAAKDLCERLGYAFPANFALVKLLWLVRNRPEVAAAAHRFLHPADFLVGKLTGSFDCTDTSNALKSGVDLLSGTWPAFIEDRLGIPLSKLPRVFRPGEKVGEISVEAAQETGLPAGTPVVAGVSDGTASFLASGASAVGDWNLTLGTTLAIRGVSRKLVRDPLGRIYCHRHPDGHWLPGGASNAGGEALVKTFGQARLAGLDRAAADLLPTSLLVYPLARRGERMPFVSSEAEGFVVGRPQSDAELYAAYLEGLALVAAWSLQEAAALGAEVDGRFFLSGGGARGKTLGRVIATALGRPLIKAAEPEAAMGSALVAAGWAWHDGRIGSAQRIMVRQAEVFEPIQALGEILAAKLQQLEAECRKRRYL